MPKILVAEDERRIRELLVDAISDAGHDVVEAKDGGEALAKVGQERPDLVLLDVMMPVLDGFQLLRKLREHPDTKSMPVVLLTAYPPEKVKTPAMRFGVTHYLTKPWDSETLELTIEIALREAEAATDQKDDATIQGMPDRPEAQTLIRTGNLLIPLEQKLGGGIPLQSLTLVVGSALTGKSVLCQHIAYGALQEGHGVAYFDSESTAQGLFTQMSSIGLKVSKHFRENELNIYPLPEPITVDNCRASMAALPQKIEGLPSKYEVIIVDAITNLAPYIRAQEVIDFFSSCRHLCDNGRAIIVVTRSSALHDENLLTRISPKCDAHMWLHASMLGTKLVLAVEVVKANNVELSWDNLVQFQIEPGVGMQIV